MLKEIRLLAPDPAKFSVAWEVAKRLVYWPDDQSETYIPLAHYPKLLCKAHAANGILVVSLTDRPHRSAGT